MVPITPVVTPFFTAAPNWNDYITADGATALAASGAACVAAAQTGALGCFHGAEFRSVTVPGVTGCAGLTGTDALGAFDWTCVEGPTRMVSTGLKAGKRLVDLLFPDLAQWRLNHVEVLNAASAQVAVTPSEQWWGNPVIALESTSTTLSTPGGIYVARADATTNITITADKVGVVVTPGLSVRSNSGTTVFASNLKHLWLEGTFRGSMPAGVYSGNALYLTMVQSSHLSDITATGARVGLYMEESANNRIFRVNASDNSDTGVNFFGQGFTGNLIQDLVATSNQTGSNCSSAQGKICTDVELVWITWNDFERVTTGVSRTGLHLNNALNNTFTTIQQATHIEGIRLDQFSDYNSFTDLTSHDTGYYGVRIESGNANQFRGAHISHTGIGFWLFSTSSTWMEGVHVEDAGAGFKLWQSSQYSVIVDAVVANCTYSLEMQANSGHTTVVGLASINTEVGMVCLDSPNNVLAMVTAANTRHQTLPGSSSGVTLETTAGSTTGCSNNVVLNLAAFHNALDGLHLLASTSNTLVNVLASNNGNAGVSMNAASTGNTFTGRLMVGNNTLKNCSTSTGTGLNDGLCTNSGASSTTLTTTTTMAADLMGRVTVDDVANAADTMGAAPFSSLTSAAGWTAFSSAHRAWGLEGTPFPDFGRCTGAGANCRIFDYDLKTTATTLAATPVVLTGSSVVNHTFSDATVAHFLPNAVEPLADGLGNDNGLCESNEACLYTPNLGTYQGHGMLVNAGSFTNGTTLTGVTLYKYANNGR